MKFPRTLHILVERFSTQPRNNRFGLVLVPYVFRFFIVTVMACTVCATPWCANGVRHRQSRRSRTERPALATCTQPSTQDLERFANTIHQAYLTSRQPDGSGLHVFSLLARPDTEIGPLERLELAPTAKIIAPTKDGGFLKIPLLETPWVHMPFSTRMDPEDQLVEMRLPKGTLAFGLGCTMVMAPRLPDEDGAPFGKLDESKKANVHATTTVANDGRIFSLLTTEDGLTFAPDGLWSHIPAVMKGVVQRSRG